MMYAADEIYDDETTSGPIDGARTFQAGSDPADRVGGDAEQERRWRLRVEASERLDHAFQELMLRVDDALDAARAVGLDHVVARFEAYDPFGGSDMHGAAAMVAELRESLAIEMTDDEPCRDCPHTFGRHTGTGEGRDESSCDKCACAAFSSWGTIR